MSDGTRSGVNWIREKVPPTTLAKVSTASVLATPGTPSMQQVALGQQADQHPLDQPVLADDHPLDLEDRAFQQGGVAGRAVLHRRSPARCARVGTRDPPTHDV